MEIGTSAPTGCRFSIAQICYSSAVTTLVLSFSSLRMARLGALPAQHGVQQFTLEGIFDEGAPAQKMNAPWKTLSKTPGDHPRPPQGATALSKSLT